MPGPRQLVAPPAFVDRNFGLLSVVQARYDEPEAHWRNGVTWTDICGLAGTTYDPYCLPSGAANTPAEKAGNVDVENFGAQPFTVFAEVECSPVGFSQQEQRARAVDALTRSEPYQVENVFFTGTAGGDTDKVYPHLAATSEVTEGSFPVILLQCAASVVSGTAEAPVIFEITQGLGLLEALMGACYGGQITLHVPLGLAERMISSGLVKADGAQMKTISGNLVAFGAGYPGTSPAQAATSGALWVYATGPVFAYRSAPETFTFKEQFNRDNNTLQTIVERTYVLGHSCCCMYAVAIATIGGVPL
jgi:hypothetical protein